MGRDVCVGAESAPEPIAAAPVRVASGAEGVVRLRAWLKGAQTGARCEYARGASAVLSAGREVCQFVQRIGHGSHDADGRNIAGLGLVTAHFARDPESGEGVYLVQRTDKQIAWETRL